jgi:hypothetical protein
MIPSERNFLGYRYLKPCNLLQQPNLGFDEHWRRALSGEPTEDPVKNGASSNDC